MFKAEPKVYPRTIEGFFQRWRWGFVWLTQLIFYGLCWLPWNGRQAVLFDLEARRFYLFDLVLWPQDTIYLAILLVLSALALFLFTAVAGRATTVTPLPLWRSGAPLEKSPGISSSYTTMSSITTFPPSRC